MKLWAGLFVALSFSFAARADFDAASYPPYETCALCHGLFGQSRLDKFPHLAGQKPGYIRAQLDAFLSGTRANDGGQMSSIVTELQPEDFSVVVAWFADQDAPLPVGPPPSDAGRALVDEAGCMVCHNGDPSDDVPHLAAQHQGYLAKQMHDFRTSRRTHSAAAALHQELFVQMEPGIDDIAAYLASMERPK